MYVERSKKKKKTPSPLARGARFREYSGVYLVVGTKFITPRKTAPCCWGKLNIFGCADYIMPGNIR